MQYYSKYYLHFDIKLLILPRILQINKQYK
jgi:hypothetical protein